MGLPTPQRNEWSQADMDYAIRLLKRGDSAEAVRRKLALRGLTQQVVASLMNEVFVRYVQANPVDPLNQGKRAKPDQPDWPERLFQQQVAATVAPHIPDQTAPDQSKGATGDAAGTFRCPRCFSSDVAPHGPRSIFDGKRLYRCNTCGLPMGPLRSRFVLWSLLVFAILATVVFAGVSFFLVGAGFFVKRSLFILYDGAKLFLGSVGLAVSVYIAISELRKPVPLRKED